MRNLKVIFNKAKLMTLVVVLAVVGIVAAPVAPVKALPQPELALSLSPTLADLKLTAGTAVAGEVLVVNDGLVPLNIEVAALPYTINDDYSQNVFDAPSTRTQIADWITFADGDSHFRLEGSERKTVHFTITVPTSAPSGGQYAAISAHGTVDGAGGVMATYQIASLLLTEVEGDTTRSGEVANRNFGGWSGSSQITTHLTVQNTGNTHFFVTNRLIITNWLGGAEAARVETDPKLVFGDDSRDFEIDWTADKPVGVYWLTQESEFLGDTHSLRRLLIILPIWFIIASLLTLALLIFSFIKLRKKLHRRPPKSEVK
jgi:hypothetical protein